MKRPVLMVPLFVCLALQSLLYARGDNNKKEIPADMSSAKKVFVGWVDLPPDQWHEWGYEGRQDWVETIKDVNHDFQSNCKDKYLSGREVTAAKDNGDENAAGNDLYIKFSDVSIDKDSYGIKLSIHFIDPKTNAEIGSIPTHLYRRKRMFQFAKYMTGALEEVGQKIEVEVAAPGSKK